MEAEKDKKYIVKLINGTTFFFGGRRFDADIPQIVSKADAERLREKHTLAAIIDPNEGAMPLKKPRFEITEVADGEVVVVEPPQTIAPITRSRVRSAA